jgi:hypothetical protein
MNYNSNGSSYAPTTNSDYKPPTNSGYEPPSTGGYQPSSTSGYEPPSSGGYEPPSSSGYEPPSSSGYEPPSGYSYTPPSYEPEIINDEPESPIDTRLKKKSFIDDNDEPQKATTEKTKAEKDREADEAFRKAAEADGKCWMLQ